MKIKKICFWSLPILAVVLLVLQVVVTSQLSPLSKDLYAIEQEVSFVKDKNELLSAKVASASALAALEVKARSLGFVEPTKQQVVTIIPEQFAVALDGTR